METDRPQESQPQRQEWADIIHPENTENQAEAPIDQQGFSVEVQGDQSLLDEGGVHLVANKTLLITRDVSTSMP